MMYLPVHFIGAENRDSGRAGGSLLGRFLFFSFLFRMFSLELQGEFIWSPKSGPQREVTFLRGGPLFERVHYFGGGLP